MKHSQFFLACTSNRRKQSPALQNICEKTTIVDHDCNPTPAKIGGTSDTFTLFPSLAFLPDWQRLEQSRLVTVLVLDIGTCIKVHRFFLYKIRQPDAVRLCWRKRTLLVFMRGSFFGRDSDSSAEDTPDQKCASAHEVAR
jgi:hypothetical protein